MSSPEHEPPPTHESLVHTKLIVLCVLPHSSPFGCFPTRGLSYLHPRYRTKDLYTQRAWCVCCRGDNFKMQDKKKKKARQTETLYPQAEDTQNFPWSDTSFSFPQPYILLSSAPFHRNSNAEVANYTCLWPPTPTLILELFEKEHVSRSSIFHLQLPGTSYNGLK